MTWGAADFCLEGNGASPLSSSAGDCSAVFSSNQQWGLNRLVNFPGDSRCLDDLAVESGGIRFAGRQSVHSFQALLSRGITSGACCSDNADAIANKQICPIFNNEGTPPNLPDKHRFRTFESPVWCSGKVTITLGIMRQGTNDLLPADLKTLLWHLFGQAWQLCHLFLPNFPLPLPLISYERTFLQWRPSVSLTASSELLSHELQPNVCASALDGLFHSRSHLVLLLVPYYGVECVSDDACSLFGLCSRCSISGSCVPEWKTNINANLLAINAF